MKKIVCPTVVVAILSFASCSGSHQKKKSDSASSSPKESKEIVVSEEASISQPEPEMSSAPLEVESQKPDLTNLHLMGTEPFWSINCKEHQMEFSPNIGEEIKLLTYKKVEGDGNRIIINANYGKDTYLIQITKEPCNDGMSDKTYEYSAVVKDNQNNKWTGCGCRDNKVFKTNYFDLPGEKTEILNALLQTENNKMLKTENLSVMQTYARKALRGKGCPFGSPYGIRVQAAYFWYIYNALPDFVDTHERHHGYYEDQNEQSAKEKLLAYSIYRLDRSAENVKALFDYVRPMLKNLMSPESYNYSGLGDDVNGMINCYDELVKIEGYQASLDQTYAVVDTLSGTIEYVDGKEVFKPHDNCYGFSVYDLNTYLLRHLNVEDTGDSFPFTEHLSFWMRRRHEGNMETVYEILKEVQEMYRDESDSQ
ncbi:hypothetical protein DMA11_19490 [Marinilabiliaceae bacterium JC017]|nr:hypothetical protein DMA11_19490 [Marinilabiliaceae bacterium JC017]